jgi:Xaa-Pro aminopeptidase
MVVSNEPGYYEDGAFGIRIENLLVGPPDPGQRQIWHSCRVHACPR